MIYVHGAKGSVYDFTLSVGARLAEQYDVLAMDRPGSGFTARPANGENSPQAQAAVLRAAAAELGLERPVLLGHSFGAAVALAWALDAPDAVAAVVTLGGYVLPLGGPPRWVVALLRSPTVLRGVGAIGRSRRDARWSRAPSGGPSPPGSRRGSTCASRRGWRSRPPTSSATARTARPPRRAWRPSSPATRASPCPLVILVGAQDRMVPPSTSERLHALVPGSEFVRVPDAGHMPQFTAPDAVVAAVDRAAELAGVASTFAIPGARG